MKREPGFYWVRLQGRRAVFGENGKVEKVPYEWEVAQWATYDDMGRFEWVLSGVDCAYRDDDFAEIDERRIELK